MKIMVKNDEMQIERLELMSSNGTAVLKRLTADGYEGGAGR